jgi:hypothetical protein
MLVRIILKWILDRTEWWTVLAQDMWQMEGSCEHRNEPRRTRLHEVSC